MKVYEAEEKYIEKLDKSVKKLVIQQEGFQYPTKNVSAWSDLPIYNELVAGYEIPSDYEIYEKDSKNINPRSNKPYKERTLVQKKGGSVNTETGDLSNVISKLDRILAILEKTQPRASGSDSGGGLTPVDYPENDLPPSPF